MTEVTPEELTALKNVAAVAPRLMAILAAPGAGRTDSLSEPDAYDAQLSKKLQRASRRS